MATGKTLCGLSYLYYLRKIDKVEKALIVVPISAAWHWYREAAKFFDDKLKVCVIGYKVDEKTGKIKKVPKEERLFQLKSTEYDGYITNYEKLKDITMNYDVLEHWNDKHKYLIIADEVTRIKTWSAQRTKMLKSLPSSYRIGLSGRPVENNLGELYTILDWIWPHCLGSYKKFTQKFLIENRFGDVVGVRDKDALRSIVDYIAIKYSRYDVLKYLPPIIRNRVDVEFSDVEEIEYRKIARMMEDALKNMAGWKRGEIMNAIAMVQLSRMYSDHPVLVRDSKSPTARALECVAHTSSKFSEFRIILDEILSLNEKVVVFSQFKKMVDLLEADTNNRHSLVKVFKYTGGMTALQKQQTIDEFRAHVGSAVFLSTDAGAYAIELPCASYIINYDLPWNPAVLEQRISRLHRPGQQKPVVVIDLVVGGAEAVEQHVIDVLAKKNVMYHDIMGEKNEFTEPIMDTLDVVVAQDTGR
jgi:SNF2 family DNA or RNA helicase